MKYADLKKITRGLRNKQTKEEIILWQFLRKRQVEGRKFLRQHPIIYESNRKELFFFVADFYCAEEKLVIELDGKIHDYQKEHDKWRDEIIQSKGIQMLHFKNEELKNVNEVLTKIVSFFNSSG
ncbi:MAG: hypothetical protein CVU00_12670 [Bacteroidetes bacterium HGW-Bacteroidetes-17]|jgi:very-short-patch-repair endonuclease|nr:MAG: hypothetical protein CVU00_12670 [Bacteroidetes bacterium HGW-Bacteroidetes-17]